MGRGPGEGTEEEQASVAGLWEDWGTSGCEVAVGPVLTLPRCQATRPKAGQVLAGVYVSGDAPLALSHQPQGISYRESWKATRLRSLPPGERSQSNSVRVCLLACLFFPC